MRAITIESPGGPDVLRPTDVPDPVPAAGEVLLDVLATAVNRADLMQRRGLYPPPPGASPYPGLECSGRIAALGPGTSGWAVGDQVCALLSGGGYAERVAVPAGQLLPIPEGVDAVTAAGLPEVVCTVWSNLFGADLDGGTGPGWGVNAGLRRGETLLVHGGAGGVGSMAIQLAKAVGARVLATAGSAEKLRRCRELGADAVIDYRGEDFPARTLEETGGRGADVVLDVVGARYLGPNLEALATGGRLVVIGLQGGRKGELDLGMLLAKRAAVLATTLRSRPVEEKSAIVAAVRERVWPLLAHGQVHAVVDRVMPLEEAARAHRLLEGPDIMGKIVLTTKHPN
jgi:putative PIG3 family NAD(P)H quinone oxidoreductase